MMRVLDQLRTMLRNEADLATADIVITCLIAADEAEESDDDEMADEIKLIAQFILFDTACEAYREFMDAAFVTHGVYAPPSALQNWRRAASLMPCPPRNKRFEKFSGLVLTHSKRSTRANYENYVLAVRSKESA